nr:hypothetical protein [Tanacetum cinerariifolium]
MAHKGVRLGHVATPRLMLFIILVAGEVNADSVTATMTIDEVTLAQALMEIKSTKPKVKGVVLQEPSESRTTTTISSKKSQDKGKDIMIEEPVKLKKKDQIMLDEEVALKLQAELQAKFDKKTKTCKVNTFELISSELVEGSSKRARTELEQESSKKKKIDDDKETAKLKQEDVKTLWKLVKAKHGSIRPEEDYERVLWGDLKLKKFKGNDPQVSRTLPQCDPNGLIALKPFAILDRRKTKKGNVTAVYKMFDKAFKRVNTFELISSDLVEGSSKRAGTELEQESSNKKKIDDDKEIAKLKQLVKIIPDEEGVAIDAIPLAVKPPIIVDLKIQKEGNKSYYKIIKADGS